VSVVWFLSAGGTTAAALQGPLGVTTKLRINIEGTLQAAKLERDRSGVPALPRKKGGAAIPAMLLPMLPDLACANSGPTPLYSLIQ
jgi:hypothetical protein